MSLHDRRKNATLTSPEGGGAAVTIDGVTMRFGDRVAASDIRVDVAPGEIVSVVGPSGCGKTTLLRAVAGLLTPSEGSVRGRRRDRRRHLDGVGMVFQHFGLFPWKTVEANVAYPLRLRGLPKEEIAARTRELIGMVGLSGFEKSYPHQLSGGMQQRTGLARALAVRPRVLLTDEPFGGARRADRRGAALRAAPHVGGAPDHDAVRHALDRRGGAVRRPGGRAEGRPGRVHEVIDVALPAPARPCGGEVEAFAALRERVWSLVMSPTPVRRARAQRCPSGHLGRTADVVDQAPGSGRAGHGLLTALAACGGGASGDEGGATTLSVGVPGIPGLREPDGLRRRAEGLLQGRRRDRHPAAPADRRRRRPRHPEQGARRRHRRHLGAVALRASGGNVVAILGNENPSFLIALLRPGRHRLRLAQGQDHRRGRRGRPEGAVGQHHDRVVRADGLRHHHRQRRRPPVGRRADRRAGRHRRRCHPDELAAVNQKAQAHEVVALAKVDPVSHYTMPVTREDELADGGKRPAWVKAAAALHKSIAYINDPANADDVAQIAATMTKPHAGDLQDGAGRVRRHQVLAVPTPRPRARAGRQGRRRPGQGRGTWPPTRRPSTTTSSTSRCSMKRSGSDSRPRAVAVALAGLALGLIAWQIAGPAGPGPAGHPGQVVRGAGRDGRRRDPARPRCWTPACCSWPGWPPRSPAGVGYGLVLSRSRALRGAPAGWCSRCSRCRSWRSRR